jgi:hypothetical protein
MKSRLHCLPAHADSLPHRSGRRRLIWVASKRDGAATRKGHVADLPSSVSVLQGLVDYEYGPGAGASGAGVRWQLWE